MEAKTSKSGCINSRNAQELNDDRRYVTSD